jgi:uncharacterized protein YceH (UPF0502 family)
MSDDHALPEEVADKATRTTSARACPLCGKPLSDDARFCPSCGMRAVDPSTLATVDAYIREKLDQEVAKRFVDQNSLAREIGDKAEDILWKRLRISGVLLAVIIAFLGFVGWKTVNDVSRSIVTASAGKVEAVNERVTQISKELDTQTKAVEDRGGEISASLAHLDEMTNAAQGKVAAYLEHAEAASEQMEKRLAELDTKVAQVSAQVDNVSVRQEYPSLGQPKVVTYKGGLWSKDSKKSNEKWIGIYIFPYAYSAFSQAEMEALFKDLRAAGYTPLPGTFGIGGPYTTGIGPLGNGTTSSIYYFSKNSEPMSAEIQAIVLKDLPVKSLDTSYVDASEMPKDDIIRFVIENSGLDLQLALRPLSGR